MLKNIETTLKRVVYGQDKAIEAFIEVTKANLASVPADYIRKQTTVGGERYVTEELGFDACLDRREPDLARTTERVRLVSVVYLRGVRDRALAEGVSVEELHHVAYLAVTTLGWPHAVRGLTWIQDLTRPEK